MSTRVIILTRVSTAEQTKNTSPEGQLALCRRKCADMGWEVAAVYQEQESGALSTISRVITNKALEDLEAGNADVLMLYDMTRYGRDEEFQHNMLKRIVRAGKQLQFATVTLDYDRRTGQLTPESRAMFNTLGGQSSVERANIARRLYNGQVQQVGAGVQVSRTQPPWGFHIVKNKDVIKGDYPEGWEGAYIEQEKTLVILREAMERYAAGASLRSTCDWLESQGVSSPTGLKHWSTASLRTILRNEAYVGKVGWGKRRRMVDESRGERGLQRSYSVPVPPDQWLTINIKPVVERELWDRCQERLDRNKAELSGRRDRRHMLTGLVKCWACGASCTVLGSMKAGVSGPKSSFGYVCCRSRLKHVDHPPPRWLGTKTFEKVIIKFVLSVLDDPDVLQEAVAAHRSRQALPLRELDADKLTKAIKALEGREMAAARAKVDAMISNQSTAPFDEMLKEFAGERGQLQTQLAQLQASDVQPPSISKGLDIAALRHLLTAPEIPDIVKGDALRRFIESITPESTYETYIVSWRAHPKNFVVRLSKDGTYDLLSC